MTKKEWFIIAIITFVTIVSWVIFDILHTRSEVEISPKIIEVIEPISPNFDPEALKLIQ